VEPDETACLALPVLSSVIEQAHLAFVFASAPKA
jgi:hypothetical protein